MGLDAVTIRLPQKRVFSFPVENPISGDDIPRLRVPRAFVVEQVIALKIGGSGTFDFEVRFSPNANDQGAGTLIFGAVGQNNETTGNVFTPPGDFAPVTVPTGDWIWLEIPSTSTGLSRVVMVQVQVVGVEKG